METRLGYIVILPWMREDLDLKGNELLVYALIHGFSQEAQGCFFGSLEYISRACGCARNTTIGTLKNLVEKGLLRKREFTENGVKVCQYTAITGGSAEIALPVQKLDGGSAKIGLGGSAEIGPNNKTIIDNKSIKKGKGTHPPLILPFSSERFIETWNALCEEKNWKGKTQKALQLTLNKLGRYHEDFAIELMEKAIEGGWKGVVFADTDAKYQEWQSARNHAADSAVQRTARVKPRELPPGNNIDQMYARLRQQREEEERAMREELERRRNGKTD